MNWDHTKFITTMLAACESLHVSYWNSIKSYAENEFKSMMLMIEWLDKMKSTGEFDASQANIHIGLQKNIMLRHVQSLPELSGEDAEKLVKKAMDSIRDEIRTQIDWMII